MNTAQYCNSRYVPSRRLSREITVGEVKVGGTQPIRVQSMTNTQTLDIEATVRQTLALAEVGCELVRITAPNKQAAKALGEIHKKVRAAGVNVPLVADIHFLPSAAMEAVEHVEKVRVNPGNYADKKKFQIREYSDQQYEEEIQRLYDAFSPLVVRAKQLGRALRIGTNHGSLSDRVMNRYGDSPLGMVEAALEFIRICESHGFHDICLSMKASNPKVMIEAYRLAVVKMAEENMHYPLHLGVTEAGDGEDARIKSAIGIGSLLYDGLGDTIRVSLTEDPVYEIPVCQDLASRAMQLWQGKPPQSLEHDSIDPFDYKRREAEVITLGDSVRIGGMEPPGVIVAVDKLKKDPPAIIRSVLETHKKQKDCRIESLMLTIGSESDLEVLTSLQSVLQPTVPSFTLAVAADFPLDGFRSFSFSKNHRFVICRKFHADEEGLLRAWADFAAERGFILALDLNLPSRDALAATVRELKQPLLFTLSEPDAGLHPVGSYRSLAEWLKTHAISSPIWIRNTDALGINPSDYFTARLIEASMLSGPLFCDGLGDIISIETEPDITKATTLAYNVLQGTRLRMSKTEFVACPSCGRTLFDLEDTTRSIRARTGHLKGVTIAVMGCIVNGPGEMADAHFGYVGGAPKKVNLYVGKECVKYNIPENEAVDRLVDLIAEHGMWIEPEPVEQEQG